MIRRNKRRFLLSLLVLSIYGLVMAFAGSLANYVPFFHAFIIFLISTPIAAYLLGMVWQFDLVLKQRDEKSSNTADSSEKRKRQALDDVLRDLSNDDLVRLKHRLQDGEIDDEILYDRLQEDGELLEQYDR